MILNEYSWIFKNSLPKHICEHIIKYALNKAIVKGTTGDRNKGNIRNSHVVWNNEPWINDLLMQYIRAANQDAGWNFNIDDNENVQFTIYDKDQYYSWHVDAWEKPYGKSSKYPGKIRKLSASIILNDDFEGGEFEFNLRNHVRENNIFSIDGSKKTGTVIVFPSEILHKVNKVTAGTRYSLVCWALGNQFK